MEACRSRLERLLIKEVSSTGLGGLAAQLAQPPPPQRSVPRSQSVGSTGLLQRLQALQGLLRCGPCCRVLLQAVADQVAQALQHGGRQAQGKR